MGSNWRCGCLKGGKPTLRWCMVALPYSKLTEEKARLLQAKNIMAADLEKLLKHREVSVPPPPPPPPKNNNNNNNKKVGRWVSNPFASRLPRHVHVCIHTLGCQ